MRDVCLTESEANELIELARGKLILHNLVSLMWCNTRKKDGDWMTNKANFHKMFDTIQIAHPHIQLNKVIYPKKFIP